ncbi:MAG: DUF2780 domain-containing protein [Cellvibrionaceae bacterium]
MKNTLIIAAVALTLSAHTHAGWFDSLFGGSSEPAEAVTETVEAPAATQALDALAMIPMLTDSLGVTEKQAEGGMGSLFNLAKESLSQDQFGELSNALPGIDQLLGAVPAVSESAQSDSGLGGLLNSAAQYSDSLKAVNQVSQQFQALGLDPQMIMQYMQVAQQYLNTPQGQQAKQLLMDGLAGLGG